MTLHVPWVSLAVLALVLLVLAMATTIGSARGAMSFEAIRAVKDDW
jgi:putative ABC transport system permease protein